MGREWISYGKFIMPRLVEKIGLLSYREWFANWGCHSYNAGISHFNFLIYISGVKISDAVYN